MIFEIAKKCRAADERTLSPALETSKFRRIYISMGGNSRNWDNCRTLAAVVFGSGAFKAQFCAFETEGLKAGTGKAPRGPSLAFRARPLVPRIQAPWDRSGRGYGVDSRSAGLGEQLRGSQRLGVPGKDREFHSVEITRNENAILAFNGSIVIWLDKQVGRDHDFRNEMADFFPGGVAVCRGGNGYGSRANAQ